MIVELRPDPARLAVIQECMENYDIGEANAEWPNNIISRHTVVYSDGTIARRNDAVSHAVDADELTLCERLSGEIVEIMSGVSIGMGSESDDTFNGFFIAAPVGSLPPSRIDEPLIRSRFGDTLFPPVTITVEPFSEEAPWWKEDILFHGEEEIEPEDLIPWRSMNRWFNSQSAFVDRAFVRIGDDELYRTDEDIWPNGTELTGSVLPRLALGLTHKGSLVGLFGYVVYT
jgi:hypothetical protein